jgi:CRP/FNR family transcriptional regulator, anaerobic regulatory protein
MNNLIHQCQEASLLNDAAMFDLDSVVKLRAFKKGESILDEGDICRHLYFINTGLVKVFSFKSGKEFIMRFFSEYQIFSVFDSYFTRTPSKFNVTALEDTIVSLINYVDMESLSGKHHSAETFLRKITADTTVRMTRRISEMLEEDSTTRYQNFVDQNKLIVQRISLGDIARYLGITQQSLSRIRLQK